MTATQEELRDWFKAGCEGGFAFMVVVCDTFDWEDYPVYSSDLEAATRQANHPGNMQKVMEVYNLKGDMDEQMNMSRCWALP